MKFNKWILGLLAISAIVVQSACAQGRMDTFNVPREVVLAGPQNFAAATGAITNSPIDTRAMTGVNAILVNAYTNTGTGGGTLTITLQTSADTTNYTTLGNLAVISTLTSTSITNSANTNITATVSTLLPGTLTTSVAATSGLAAVNYLVPLPYTNTGAITIPTGNPLLIGIRTLDDIPNRYLRAIITPGGTVTNYTFGGATLITLPSSYPGL